MRPIKYDHGCSRAWGSWRFEAGSVVVVSPSFGDEVVIPREEIPNTGIVDVRARHFHETCTLEGYPVLSKRAAQAEEDYTEEAKAKARAAASAPPSAPSTTTSGAGGASFGEGATSFGSGSAGGGAGAGLGESDAAGEAEE